MNEEPLERLVGAAICPGDGLTAREIAGRLDIDRTAVNHLLYASPLLRELCYQDASYRWHGIIRQTRPHAGLFEFSGYYGTVMEFLDIGKDEQFHESADKRRFSRAYGADNTKINIAARPFSDVLQYVCLFQSFPSLNRFQRECSFHYMNGRSEYAKMKRTAVVGGRFFQSVILYVCFS